MKKLETKDLALIAMYAAMFIVLEYVTRTLNILKMPQGGRLSLSVIALLMASYHLGFRKSLIMVALSMTLRFIIFPPKDIVSFVQFFLDYILAFGVYSMAVLFKDWEIGNFKLPIGVLVTNFLRFMSHNFAGWAFFSQYYEGNVFWGVVLYNTPYMLATALVSFIVIMLVKPKLESRF